MRNTERTKIADIITYYVVPSYDGVEAEDDKNWDTEDLISLRDAINDELILRSEVSHMTPNHLASSLAGFFSLGL